MRVELRSGSPRSTRFRTILALLCTAVGVAALVIVWQQPGFPEVPPAAGRPFGLGGQRRRAARRPGEHRHRRTRLRGAAARHVRRSAGPAGSRRWNGVGRRSDQARTAGAGHRDGHPRCQGRDSRRRPVALRGGTVAVADRQDGRLWVGTRDRHRLRRRPRRRSDRHPRCASGCRHLHPRHRLRHVRPGAEAVSARRARGRADQHRPSRRAAVARRHGRRRRRRPGRRSADHHGGRDGRRPGSGRLLAPDRRPADHAAGAAGCAAAAARTGGRGGADRDVGRPGRGRAVRRRRPHRRRVRRATRRHRWSTGTAGMPAGCRTVGHRGRR